MLFLRVRAVRPLLRQFFSTVKQLVSLVKQLTSTVKTNCLVFSIETACFEGETNAISVANCCLCFSVETAAVYQVRQLVL